MASILVVGDDIALVRLQTALLEGAGHEVEAAPDTFRARERLSGMARDLVIIDVRSPDGGMGLLITQARAAWPGCAVLALVKKADLRGTKVHEMGLWTPDAVLVQPIEPAELLGTVAALADRPTAGPPPKSEPGAVL